jgi:hypothetical protein
MKFNLTQLLVAFTVGALAATGVAYASYQPHMDNALEDLHHAHHQLEEANHDKGGHRDNALGLIDQAIGEVQAGIAVGNEN